MKSGLKGFFLGSLLLLGAVSAFAAPGIRVSGAIWANDALFDTVITDTNFHLPPAHSTDTLYNFAMSGLTGQRSVSESGPGDRDFNGGRWAVKLAVFTDTGRAIHDPDGDGAVNFELTNVNDLYHHVTLGHLEIVDTGIYFECPLLPRKR